MARSAFARAFTRALSYRWRLSALALICSLAAIPCAAGEIVVANDQLGTDRRRDRIETVVGDIPGQILVSALHRILARVTRHQFISIGLASPSIARPAWYWLLSEGRRISSDMLGTHPRA